MPDSDILLELEGCSQDCKSTFARLQRYFESETAAFDADRFGRALFGGLEKAYYLDAFSITVFAKTCYHMWALLPKTLAYDQPFWTLYYADEPLSNNDEAQSRDLYREAFDFYKEQ